MKIQLSILFTKIKENIKWLVLLIILSILCLILFKTNNIGVSRIKDFLILINYPNFSKTNNFSLIVGIYNIVLFIYLGYLYYTYEFTYSVENIIIRTEEKKWFINKNLVFFLYTLIFTIINTLLIYIYFYGKFEFKVEYLYMPLIFRILIFQTSIIIFNNIKSHDYIFLLLTLLLFAFIVRPNCILGLCFIAINFIINYLTFNIKKILK